MKRIIVLMLLLAHGAMHAMEPTSKPGAGGGGGQGGAAHGAVDPQENICPICWQDLADESHETDSIIMLPCHATHRFHKRCILQGLASNSACPLCRAPVQLDALEGITDDDRRLFALMQMRGLVGQIEVLLQQHVARGVEQERAVQEAALFVAAENNDVVRIEWLLGLVNEDGRRQVNVNARAENQVTPLHVAAKNGCVEAINALRRAGARIEVQDRWWNTPLHYAARHGHVEAMRTLLAAGAVIDAQGANLCTALHWAVRYDHLAAVNELLANEATVDAQDLQLLTPLHYAVRHNYIAVADILLAYHAQVDARTAAQKTPLHIATQQRNIDAVRQLLVHHARLDAVDVYGFTPYDYAVLLADEEAKAIFSRHTQEQAAAENIRVMEPTNCCIVM